jgi:hypothetical protein
MGTKKISVTCLVIALLASSISISLIPAKSAGAADPMPKVDVWTDKGGKGVSDSGGTFTVGEKTVIYAYTNMPGQEYCQIWGPHGKELDESRQLTAAGTITFDLGTAEEKDVGNWQIMFGVSSGNYVGGDFMKWTVVAASSPQTSSPPATPSTSDNTRALPQINTDIQWQVTIGASRSSAVDALIALKMANKVLSENLTMDIDSDGKVTTQDAKAILRRSVRGQVEFSAEQRRLLNRFSAPDTFVLSMGMDTIAESPQFVRSEQWNYHDFGAGFNFRNGKFDEYDSGIDFEAKPSFSKFRPNQFVENMTLQDINALVGDVPQIEAEYVPNLVKNAKVYIYAEGLVVGIQDGKVIYVCSLPASIE